MCEELGDVLTQVVFHADLERQAGRFCLEDVYDSICTKMIGRHPHIFGQTDADRSNAPSWDELKRLEKGQKTEAETLQAVCRALPALWRAEKLQKKAANAGFSWDCAQDALQDFAEKAAAFQRAAASGQQVQDALGDVLFSAVGAASLCQTDPEQALHGACQRFIDLFTQLEKQLAQEGRSFSGSSRRELTSLRNSGQPQSRFL